MSRVVGSKRVAGFLLGASVLASSCAVGVIEQPDEAVERSRAMDDGSDGASLENATDDGGVVRSDGGEQDAALDECSEADSSCACERDSDHDGAADCVDECPLDPRSTVAAAWYADCDGDGNASDTPRRVCAGALRRETCQDGAAPDGQWSESPGTDCNDEDAAATELRDFYPDCDGDGKASVAAMRACGVRGASATFDCADGRDPDGGFWSVQGIDCADEDPSKHGSSDWFADCDGDGAPTSVPVHACGIRGANEVFTCADGKAPDGGFWSVPGSDCNDEDATLVADRDWFPDCDGDGVRSGVGARACGRAGARALFDCADGEDPDGGFGPTQGSDCDDENADATVLSDWFADCDGDGVHASRAIRACGIAGAAATSTCLDGLPPDGGFASLAGQDCNDELGTDRCPCGTQDDDGDGTCVPLVSLPSSCREALERDPLATDGDYEIDPDGVGVAPSLLVRCDMSGGGFTEIAREDFDAGSSLGWHAADDSPTAVDTASTCAAHYGPMLGGFGILGGGGAQTSKTFSLLGIPHSEVSVVLDYVVLDSWDTEAALVYVDEVERYRASYVVSDAATNACGGGWPDHGPQHVSIAAQHEGDSVTVRVTSTLDQSSADESFGVDNVRIRVR